MLRSDIAKVLLRSDIAKPDSADFLLRVVGHWTGTLPRFRKLRSRPRSRPVDGLGHFRVHRRQKLSLVAFGRLSTVPQRLFRFFHQSAPARIFCDRSKSVPMPLFWQLKSRPSRPLHLNATDPVKPSYTSTARFILAICLRPSYSSVSSPSPLFRQGRRVTSSPTFQQTHEVRKKDQGLRPTASAIERNTHFLCVSNLHLTLE